MKFTHGFWMMRPEVGPVYPIHLVDCEHTESTLVGYAPGRRLNHRGDTLNAPILTVTTDSPGPDIIRIRAEHHRGAVKRGPAFGIADEHPPVVIEETDSAFSLSSGRLTLRMRKGETWGLDFLSEGMLLTDSGWRNLAYMCVSDTVEPAIGSEEPHHTGARSFMVEQLRLSPGELVYGLGERFTPIVRNGQSVDIWNEDPGTASEQSYKNIPFYFTNRGYGVLVADPGRVSFEVGSEKVGRVSFSVPGESLEYYVIYGPSPAEIIRKYTALTGRPSLPPAWSFGLWLSTSFTPDYDERTVLEFIEGMERRGIPLRVFHFDCFWMKPYSWVDFTWNPETFPDPIRMLKRIKAHNLTISLWINPYIAQKSSLFDEASEKGYLLHRADGSVRQTDLWQAGMGLVDFTNPEARRWYQDHLRRLLRQGVDCFKTDFGERIPVDVVYADGSDPVKMHNYYAFLYNETVMEVLRDERGSDEAVVFARSATAGSQQFPVHWGGDCMATYDSMAESLRGGLSLVSSGFAFWSHDIGGFENTATPDLYKRWSAFGLLSSHSRLHGSHSYRVPWHFDEEAVDVLRHFTRLKMSLMPYLYRYAAESVRTGVPLMRPMYIEFPHDRGCDYLDRQYMLGPSLLVAPVFDDTNTAEFYVPPGTWCDLQTGAEYAGPRWYRERYDYFHLPLLVRPGSIIARGSVHDRPDYAYHRDLTWELFPPWTTGREEMIVDHKGREVLRIRTSLVGEEPGNQELEIGLDLVGAGAEDASCAVVCRGTSTGDGHAMILDSIPGTVRVTV